MIADSTARFTEGQTYQVLLVCGEPSVAERLRSGVRGMLGAGDLHLSVADSLATARTRVRSNRCDLVLVSLALPDATESEVLEQIGLWSLQCPVVALGDEGHGERAARARERGAVEVLPGEGLPLDLFVPLLRQIARSRRVERELRAKLQESRALTQRYQGILRNTPDGLCHLNTDWQIMVTNQTMKQIFDPQLKLTEEVFGRAFADLFGSLQEFERYRRIAEESLESTGANQQEIELRRWDGVPIFVQISIAFLDPVRPELGYVATLTDVTEHQRTRESLRYQEELEALTTSISARFLALDSRMMEPELNQALGRIGEFLDVDRCYLIHLQKGGAWPPTVFEWTAEGVESAFSSLASESPDVLGWSMECFAEGKVAQARSVVTLDSRLPEREFLITRSVRSFMAIPLTFEGELAGCLGVHTLNSEKSWTDETLSPLQFIGLVFVNTFRRGETLNILTRLSSVVEQTADSVVITDTEGTIEYVNPAFEQKTGYTSREALGQNPRLIRSGMHDTAFYKELWDTIRSGHSYHGTIINRRKSGDIYYEAQTITPIRDTRGVIRHFVSTAKDITDQVLTEKKLRSSESRLRHLLETPNVIPWEADPESRNFTYVGIQAQRILGYPLEEWLKPGFWKQHIHPDDMQKAELRNKSLSPSQTHYEFEYRMIARNGKVRWMHEVVSHEMADQGPGVLRGFLFDITEKKSAEEALRESERRYRGLVESQHDLIIRIVPDGQFTFCNDACSREFGISSEDYGKTSFFSFVHPEDRTSVQETVEGLKQPPHRARFTHRRSTIQGDRWLEWEAYGIEDDRGTIAEIQAIGRDVTDREQLATEREVLQRITHHMTLPVTLNQVARIIAFESRNLFHHDAMWFSLYDKAQNTLSGVYIEDTAEGEHEPREVPFEKTIELGREYPFYTSSKSVLINRTEETSSTDLIRFGNTDRISRSLMFAPVIWEDRIVAVLSVQSYTPGRYSHRDLRVLESLADQCGGVIARIRLEDERETLQRLSQQLTTVRSPRDLGIVLACELQPLLAYDALWFNLYDPARRRFTQTYVEDLREGDDIPTEVPPGVLEISPEENRLYDSGEPGLIQDTEEAETPRLHRFGTAERRCRSILYAPVSWKGQVVAVLSVQSYSPRRYTSRELHLLQAFADQCGGTLARVRAEGEREALQRLSDRLLGRMSVGELGHIVAEECRRVFENDSFFLDLLTESQELGSVVYYEDLLPGAAQPAEVKGGPLRPLSPLSKRIAAGESVLLNRDEVNFEPGLQPFGDTERPSRSMMFVPVRREKDVIGILSVQSYTPGRYGEDDLHLLEAFAAQCATALARVWASEALTRETASLNHIIEYNPYAILVTDSEGAPVKTNPAYMELFGAPPSPEYSLFSDPDLERQNLLDLVREVQSGKTVSIPDVWYALPGSSAPTSGRQLCLRSVVFPIISPQGTIDSYVVMHQDVTARMRAEEERERLTEELIEKERLAAMGQTIAEVAHCMKNIFTAVNGGIYLLEQSLKMNRWDLTRRSYQTLRQSATRLYLFLMNMLDFSKKRDAVKEEVSISSILDDVVRMLQANADARNITIGSRVDRGAEVLRLDSQGLFRTLLNLGLNAIDAMPKGGSLEFAATIRARGELLPPLSGNGAEPPDSDVSPAEDHETVAAIEVADTGAGISREVLERIFDPFFSTKGSRGTGLGLSSAQKFIQEQGGEIRVASEQGKGTRFQLVFPL